MLTAAQRDDFDRTGLLRLDGAIPRADVRVMCDRIWAHVGAGHAMARSDPATWLIGERMAGLREVTCS